MGIFGCRQMRGNVQQMFSHLDGVRGKERCVEVRIKSMDWNKSPEGQVRVDKNNSDVVYLRQTSKVNCLYLKS